MAAADGRIRRPKLTFAASSNKEGRLLNGNDLPVALALINPESPIHMATPGPIKLLKEIPPCLISTFKTGLVENNKFGTN